MDFKPIIVAGALLISGSALAQQAPQQATNNFILGHGFLQPAATPTSDYPPGHQMKDSSVSMPASRAATGERAKSWNGIDAGERK